MTSIEQPISHHSVADIVLNATRGTVLAIGGLDGVLLRRLIEAVEPVPASARALFVRISRAQTTDSAIQQFIHQLAETAQRLWPVWFTDASFAECRADALGRLAGYALVRRVAAQIRNLQVSWAEAAIDLAIDQKHPRVAKTPPEVELAQLSLAINRYGLVIVVDAERACSDSNATAFVYALEWIAQLANCAVVALFRNLPRNQPPFDRILYGARAFSLVEDDISSAGGRPAAQEEVSTEEVWLAPWLGSPHPLSEIEQRLERALRSDNELAQLFDCNQFVETIRGSRPKVDFVWPKGQLVVELDGYGSHGNRLAFMYDRHRDYELTLSGYTVLRLANDEIAQDIGKSIEKIRDIVHLCRNRIN